MENQKKERGSAEKSWWNLLGQILSFFLMIAYALWVANSYWSFIPAGIWYDILSKVMFYGPLALIIIVTFEMFSNKNVILRFIVLAIWVAIIILSFFPGLVGL